MKQQPLAVIAVGGNALIQDPKKVSMADQRDSVQKMIGCIADMIEDGWRVVLTHGNGPQVGFALLKSEHARDIVPLVPLDYAVSETQGTIGYTIQQVLNNELRRRGIQRNIVTLITQVEVDANDPAFSQPNKPIGAFMSAAEAQERHQQDGWSIMEDSNRGWRRCVASPKPQFIHEAATIEQLLNAGSLVIACGGGGIPVVENADGGLQGIEAVIDKDFASSLLAQQLKADLFMIPTGVEKVALNFGQEDQQWLDDVDVATLKTYLEQQQFGSGSMKPKVEAVIGFLENQPQAKALITSPYVIAEALQHQNGTWVRAQD